jgi:hypothetical protein
VFVEHRKLQIAPTLGRLGKWVVFMIKEIFETEEFLEILDEFESVVLKIFEKIDILRHSSRALILTNNTI